MEIEIESKKNNPLLKRIEVQFTVRHESKGTPDRDLIRNELADRLNTKKENIIVQTINSSFGTQESTGYAKIYTSTEKAKEWERDHILKRNKIGTPAKKEEKKEESAETSKKQPAELPQKEKKEEKSSTEATEQSTDESAKEETTAPEIAEKKKEEPAQSGDTAEPDKKEEQQPAEEKKE